MPDSWDAFEAMVCAGQEKKDRSRVFVGGDWSPEGGIAEMLQRVGKRVVRGIAVALQTVAFGKLLGRKRGET